MDKLVMKEKTTSIIYYTFYLCAFMSFAYYGLINRTDLHSTVFWGIFTLLWKQNLSQLQNEVNVRVTGVATAATILNFFMSQVKIGIKNDAPKPGTDNKEPGKRDS